ncbi:hypothetical protein DdX_22002 [Ditylenchus destructor]|uniref:Uncharacterized protein n=1 Tax=Ditylenchus destructor TaxID=166010 RepID=A0AAD4MEZ2_9BILA|nr:hypothetical protein DdX_22002 [Ditylenchus destructor]
MGSAARRASFTITRCLPYRFTSATASDKGVSRKRSSPRRQAVIASSSGLSSTGTASGAADTRSPGASMASTRDRSPARVTSTLPLSSVTRTRSPSRRTTKLVPSALIRSSPALTTKGRAASCVTSNIASPRFERDFTFVAVELYRDVTVGVEEYPAAIVQCSGTLLPDTGVEDQRPIEQDGHRPGATRTANEAAIASGTNRCKAGRCGASLSSAAPGRVPIVRWRAQTLPDAPNRP